MDWNEERIETLTRLWREGLSASQVARQLGDVSRSAVIGKVHRLGIAGRDAPARPNALGGRPSTRGRASAGGVRRSPAAAGAPRPRRTEQPTNVVRVAFEVTPTANIHSLTEHACRWPIGDPDDASFGFCGRSRSGPGAYCAGHAPMAVRRRDTPMKAKEIDRLVTRFAEASYEAQDLRWREIA